MQIINQTKLKELISQITAPQGASRESWHNYFKNIYYINLDSRKDRRECIEEQCRRLNINAQRIQAVEMKDKHWHNSPGTYACKISHTNIINLAIKKNLDNVLIFEDDVLLCRDLNERMEEIIPILRKHEWDLFYMYPRKIWGRRKNRWQWAARVIKDLGPIVQINKAPICTHAYAINKCAYIKLREIWFKSTTAIDWELFMTDHNLKILAVKNTIASQSTGWSDIDKTWKWR